MPNKQIATDKYNVDSNKPADEEKNLFITAFSDGSFCPETKAWGVGIWIRDGSGSAKTLSFGGAGIAKSSMVEERGLQELVRYIKENINYQKRVIVIECDSSGALEKVNKAEFPGAKFVKLKHVKGHTNNKTSRTKVNKMVDKLAGEEMSKYREEVRRKRQLQQAKITE